MTHQERRIITRLRALLRARAWDMKTQGVSASMNSWIDAYIDCDAVLAGEPHLLTVSKYVEWAKDEGIV